MHNIQAPKTVHVATYRNGAYVYEEVPTEDISARVPNPRDHWPKPAHRRPVSSDDVTILVQDILDYFGGNVAEAIDAVQRFNQQNALTA